MCVGLEIFQPGGSHVTTMSKPHVDVVGPWSKRAVCTTPIFVDSPQGSVCHDSAGGVLFLQPTVQE
eukprot:3732953-Prorocentrum_lima.AAC.1